MKTVEEIYEEMMAVFRRETGAEGTAASDLSVKLYAVAAQIYGLYAQAEWLARQCFPQTARGEYLDRHAAIRGLERRGAVAAGGVIRFSLETPAATDLTIPAGTVCATAGQVRFETVGEGILQAGKTAVEVPARAVKAGTEGNVAAGTILAMAVPPVGVSGCINPAPFSGGVDEEGDEDLRKRVLETYRRMPNGANAAFYEQGALSFEKVAACTVLPRQRGVGTVDVVVATPEGIPDGTLLEELEGYFAARREIAVDVQVKAPGVKSVNVSVKVTPHEGADAAGVKEKVEKALREYFSGERLSRDVLVARLYQLVLGQDGVENCKITAPAADVAVRAGELPRLGTLTVEVTA